jgi:hypothetical protein
MGPAGEDGAWYAPSVGVWYGLVRVTVVVFGPQWLQTVTVVYQPSGTSLDVGLGATPVYVLVMVAVTVVKPVSQTSMYVVV